MPPPEPTGRLAFDDVVIDFTGRRLWRDGIEQPLEPKAYAVLALLAGSPGRAFARDEILDAVWGHRHVTPGVLNRVMTLLRHALGEEAHAAHYLHTVHGVGYRFDLPVAAVREAAPPLPGSGPQALDDAPAGNARPGDEATAVAPAGDGGAPMAAAVPTPASARGLARATPWLVALLVLLVAVAGWRLWPAAGPVAPADPAVLPAGARASPTLVLLPLQAVGGSHGETVLADGLSEELTTRLSRIEGLGVICRTSAMIAHSRQLDSVQLAEQLKATHALEGSVSETGDQLRVNLRLSELPDSRVIWTQTYDRPIAGFAALQNDVAADIARAMKLRDGADPAVEVREVDPLALRRFLDLRRQIRGSGLADWETQLRALSSDYPDYAQPHGLLGALLASRTPMRREEARREAERALQLDPDEAEARVTLAWVAIQDGDWEGARQMYDEAIRLAPTDPAYRVYLALQLGGLGYLDDALREVEVGAAYGPLGRLYLLNMQARLLDALGRHDEARQAIDAAQADVSSPGGADILGYTRWYNAWWRGDVAAARAAAADLPESIWKASYVAVAATMEDPGQWPRARAAMDESERLARGRGDPQATHTLRLLDPRPGPGPALVLARRLQREIDASQKLAIWMPEQHALRQTPEFQQFLRDSGLLDYWRRHGFPPQCRPQGEGAACD